MKLPLLLCILSSSLLAAETTASLSCGELAARMFAADQQEALAHIAQAYQELWQSLAPETSPAQFEALSKGDPFALPEALQVKHLVLEQSLKELKLISQKAHLDLEKVQAHLQKTIAQWGKKIEETENRILEQNRLEPIEQPVQFSPTQRLQSNWESTIFVASKNSILRISKPQNIIEVHTEKQKRTYSFPEISRIQQIAIANSGTLYLLADEWVWKTNLLSPNNRLKQKLALEKWKLLPTNIGNFPLEHHRNLQFSPDEQLLQGSIGHSSYMEVASLGKEEIQTLYLREKKLEPPHWTEEAVLFSRFLNGQQSGHFGITLHASKNPEKQSRKEVFQLFRLDQGGKLYPDAPFTCDPLPQGFIPSQEILQLIPSSDPNQVSVIIERYLYTNQNGGIPEDSRPILVHFDLKNKKGRVIPWKGAFQSPISPRDSQDQFLLVGQLKKNTHVLLKRQTFQESKLLYHYYLANPQTGEVKELNLANLVPRRGENAEFSILSTSPGTNRVLLKNRKNAVFSFDLTPYLP